MDRLTIPLAEQVFDENALCELLHVNRDQLAELRNRKQLPVIRLNARKRVYLASSILAWLEGLEAD